MERKGFTLIELLAVIVILAIIVLVATPMVLDTIENARKGAVKSSALAYIGEVEKQIVVGEMTTTITDGIYYVEDLNVSMKGNTPSAGFVTVKGGVIATARLCLEDYSIDYNGENTEVSDNSYCGGEIVLRIKEEEIKKPIARESEFNIAGKDISNITNIACNNGVEVKVEGNIVKISNALGNTVCTMNTALATTINNLDNSENYIVMLHNEVIDDTLTIADGQKVTIDTNSKIISSNSESSFQNEGILFVMDTNQDKGTITSNGITIFNNVDATLVLSNVNVISTNTFKNSAICQNGKLHVKDGSYIEGRYGIGCHEANNALTVIDASTVRGTDRNALQTNAGYSSKLIINESLLSGSYAGIVNNGTGNVSVNNGIIIGETSSGIINNSIGEISIQENESLYISSLATDWAPAIRNNSTGVINIMGHHANECTSDSSKTTKGICVYVEGDQNYLSDTSNTAVSNIGDGIINIDGGTFVSGYFTIGNHNDGIININDANIISQQSGINNIRTGTVNICGGVISSIRDNFVNMSTGYINHTVNCMK